MSLVFAATFFLLWRHRPQQRYVAVLSCAFIALSGGFLLQYFVIVSDTFSRLVSNLLLLTGGAAFFSASLARFNRKAPIRLILAITGVGFSVFVWFLYVDHDITMRIYVINFTAGAIMAVVAVEVMRSQRKLIDNLLLAQLVFWAATFFVRPVVVVWIDGPYETYEALHNSLYWITLTFSASLFLLLFPLMQITAIALDVMDELKQESLTDMLSGLLNRRGFEKRLDEIIEQRRFSGLPVTLPVALVVCDLDRFKAVNDTFGHAVGDRLIALFARTLQEAASPRHVVGRIGGEEFAVILPDASLAVARLFAETARISFSRSHAEDLPHTLTHTASFGVAEMAPGDTPASLMARADAALYEAKRTGRDRVKVARLRQIIDEGQAFGTG